MIKLYNFQKDKLNLPTIIAITATIIGFFHFFSYLFPFTDNAFVVANTQTVAADIEGYITSIYVKNGEKVKKNQPIFEVFAKPYDLAYKKAKAQYEESQIEKRVLEEKLKTNRLLLQEYLALLAKIEYEYQLKSNPSVKRSVSDLEIKTLNFDVQAMQKKIKSLGHIIKENQQQIFAIQKRIHAFKADKLNAKVNLELTKVRAGSDGIIDNMYFSVGTPITKHRPLFAFINTNDWYIQANFNETDLRYVRPGDKAIIILRMYYFKKIFHGVIVNQIWAANRQHTETRSQQQNVFNENQWLNLPQRFPLQIKIIDPDPNYPLNPGASAFVYIRT